MKSSKESVLFQPIKILLMMDAKELLLIRGKMYGQIICGILLILLCKRKLIVGMIFKVKVLVMG